MNDAPELPDVRCSLLIEGLRDWQAERQRLNMDASLPSETALLQAIQRINASYAPRACSQSSQPDESTREMNERQERLGEFVIARGDASELLDPAEETFDQVDDGIDADD